MIAPPAQPTRTAISLSQGSSLDRSICSLFERTIPEHYTRVLSCSRQSEPLGIYTAVVDGPNIRSGPTLRTFAMHNGAVVQDASGQAAVRHFLQTHSPNNQLTYHDVKSWLEHFGIYPIELAIREEGVPRTETAFTADPLRFVVYGRAESGPHSMLQAPRRRAILSMSTSLTTTSPRFSWVVEELGNNGTWSQIAVVAVEDINNRPSSPAPTP